MKNFLNPLPGVPLVESPFFDRFFSEEDTDAGTLRVARELREKGFAVLDFPDADIEQVADRIKMSLVDHCNLPQWREDPHFGLRIQDAWRFNDDVRRVATNESILSLLNRLYGRLAFPFQSLTFPVGTQQHFHTDSVHFSSQPERFMCGVWVALEDIGLDQGPLYYYPGSHRWPIYTNEHIGRTFSEHGTGPQLFFEPMWRDLVSVYKVAPEYFTPKKGQALIWAANLLHGGSVHKNPAMTRWSQVTHYYFEGCAYYTPIESDPALGAIRFREPESIVDGKVHHNTYNGHLIPHDFIERTNPDLNVERIGGGDPLPADFSGERYVALNPDVGIAGIDPIVHYQTWGRFEDRDYK